MESANSNAHYDAIIIGSGAGGAAAAYGLVNAGMRVLLIERGDYLIKDSITLDAGHVVQQGLFKSGESWRDRRGRTLVPQEYSNVGGKTKWYGAALLRYAHHEFDADDAHQCTPWPFPFAALGSYYTLAEKRLGARHFDCEPDLEKLLARLSKKAPAWKREAIPLGLLSGILSNANEARRFDGFASPTDLKCDADTAFIAPIRDRDNFTMMARASVIELLGDPTNAAQMIGVRVESGQRLYARSVLLAAGALHSPRLLQRYFETSGLGSTLPAFKSVGRNLKLHLRTAVIGISFTRKTDLLRKTQLLLNAECPHSSVQPLGFDGELTSTLISKRVPRFIATMLGARSYAFLLQTEDGAHADNRVYDDTDGKGVVKGVPIFDYDSRRSQNATREHALLVRRFRGALRSIGMLSFSRRIGMADTSNASGTLATGNNPDTSVVNAAGAVHGLQSLYVVDGSVLPRSSRVGPSLSIFAWSLRVADHVAMQLRTSPNHLMKLKDILSP